MHQQVFGIQAYEDSFFLSEKKVEFFFYQCSFFFSLFSSSLSHSSAMPRSFLVRSKRSLRPSQSRFSYRKQRRLEADRNLPVMWGDRRSSEHEVQLQTPSVPVSHGIAGGPPNWDRTGAWPHVALSHLLWPSGTQEFD